MYKTHHYTYIHDDIKPILYYMELWGKNAFWHLIFIQSGPKGNIGFWYFYVYLYIHAATPWRNCPISMRNIMRDITWKWSEFQNVWTCLRCIKLPELSCETYKELLKNMRCLPSLPMSWKLSPGNRDQRLSVSAFRWCVQVRGLHAKQFFGRILLMRRKFVLFLQHSRDTLFQREKMQSICCSENPNHLLSRNQMQHFHWLVCLHAFRCNLIVVPMNSVNG